MKKNKSKIIPGHRYFIIEMECRFFDLTPGKQYLMSNNSNVVFDDIGEEWPVFHASNFYKIIGVISNIKLK